MKSETGLAITWVTMCLFSVPVFAGILQPGDIVFADGGLEMVIGLDPNTHATNHIAAIDFTGASGGIAVGRNGDIYAMRFNTIYQRTDFIRN